MTRSRDRATPEHDRERLILKLAAERRLAHGVLFRHRHPQESPAFHYEIIDAWHSPRPLVVTEAFRGGAKSTIGEEVTALRALFREFRNGIVVGATEARAMERLEAVKHEISTNEDIHEVFGRQQGAIWGGHKALLLSGTILQAVGVGQSLRGIKYLQWRPDFCWIDDIEDEESVRDATARAERLAWLYKTLLPALAKDALVRMTGNRLDSEAVIAKVAADKDWYAQRFPIRYRHPETGQWTASWPAMRDLDWIEKSRTSYARMGQLSAWENEYMCEADVPDEARDFKADQIKVIPRARTWEATYAMYDPARTKSATSATTGKAVWSWVGQKLVVWSGFAKKLLPDEIIRDLFETNDGFAPIHIGFEEDGLNEWALQPIRAEMLRRGESLPLKPVKAPQGKLSFIRGLQTFFSAGLVEFAFDDSEARAQFLNFPREPIDFPNALAYALRLRPGQPIYEDFSREHVVDEIGMVPRLSKYLAVSAGAGHVAAALVQYANGVRILADWVMEGDAGQVAAELLYRAQLEAGSAVKLYAPPENFDKWANRGLRAALMRVPVELARGGDPMTGRMQIRRMLGQQRLGVPMVQVSSAARWTLNGFAGGFARDVRKGGLVTEAPAEGPYRTLMEAIESLVAIAVTIDDNDNEDARWSTSRDGRAYRSAMPAR